MHHAKNPPDHPEQSAPCTASGGRKPALSWEELEVLANELSSITKANLPLAPGIAILAEEAQDPRFKSSLRELQRALERGDSLAEALPAMERPIPPVFLSLVRAGEASGRLAEVLEMLAGYTKHTILLRSRLRQAMIYPAMLTLGSFLVILFILVAVVPDFTKAIDGLLYSSAPLPMATRLLIGVSEFVRLNGVVLTLLGMAGLAVMIVLRRRARSWVGEHVWWDAVCFAIPVLGRTRYIAALVRFSRSLGILLASQVNAADSLNLAAATSGSALLMRAARQGAARMEQGAGMAECLRGARIFPRDFCWLLATSEERGHPHEGLLHAAEKFELELSMREHMLAGMLNPVAVLLIGALVCGVLAALYWPVITWMNQGFGAMGLY